MGSPSPTLLVVNPDEDKTRIAALQDLDGAENWEQISETDQSELESDEDLLVDNMTVAGFPEDTIVEKCDQDDEWYEEEALLLGKLRGAEESEEMRLKK